MTGRLALVVVSYGSSGLLRTNLARTASGLPDAIVVVVDNPTSGSERDAVRELGAAHGWELVLPDTNTGFGGGVDLGAARALECGATALVLLNPDLAVSADDVRRLVAQVEADPRALVAPRIIRPDGSLWSAGVDLDLSDGRMRSVASRVEGSPGRREFWLSGACLALSAELWRDVGGLPTEYFLYWEDVELSHRVRSCGGSLQVCPNASAVHAEGGTQRQGLQRAGARKSHNYYYYNTRNRLLYAARLLPTPDVVRWRRNAWPVAREILLQGGRRQLLRSLAPVLSVGRGTLAGLRLSRAELRRRAAATSGSAR